jgi:dihydrofolate synthase/folylpolyglutamate synthase
LADKDIAAIARLLDPLLLAWHVAGIGDAGPRGLSADAVAERLAGIVAPDRLQPHASVAEALAAALAASAAGQRVLVFGSFHTVADAMRAEATGQGGGNDGGVRPGL